MSFKSESIGIQLKGVSEKIEFIAEEVEEDEVSPVIKDCSN
jgi:hypothetical protein